MGHAWMVPKGGFEPPPSYRGLGPEPSASANSATLVQTWNGNHTIALSGRQLLLSNIFVNSIHCMPNPLRPHRHITCNPFVTKILCQAAKWAKLHFPNIPFGDAKMRESRRSSPIFRSMSSSSATVKRRPRLHLPARWRQSLKASAQTPFQQCSGGISFSDFSPLRLMINRCRRPRSP